MKCANCGSEVTDDNKFCPNCGEKMVSPQEVSESPIVELDKQFDRVEEPAQSQPNQGEATASLQQEQPQQNQAQAGFTGQANPNPTINPQVQPNVNAGAADAQPVKKKSKAPLFIGLGVLAIVLIAIVGFAVFAGQNFFRRTFSSATNYYKYVERKNNNNNENWKAYDTYVKRLSDISSSKYTNNISLELSDDAKDAIADYSDYADLSWLEKFDMVTEFSGNGGNYEATLNSKVNEQDLVSFKMYADEDNLYFGVPDLTEDYLQVSKEYLSDNGFDFDAYMDSYQSLPSKDQLKKLTTKYLDIYLDNISGVKKERTSLEASGVRQSAYKLSYTLEDDAIKDMFSAIAEEANNDDDFKEVVRAFLEASFGANASTMGTSVDDMMDMFESNMEDAVDNIDDMDFEGISLSMDTYVDGSGNIIGRDINVTTEDSEVAMNIAFTKKGRDVGVLYRVATDDSTFELSGSGKLSGSNLSGEFNVIQDDSTLIVIDIEKLNLKKISSDKPEMALSIRGEDISDLFYLPDLSDYSLRLEADKGTSTISVLDGEDALVTVTSTDNKEASKKISVPEDVNFYDIEEDGVEEWIATFDTEAFIDQLNETDIPAEWIESLESTFEYINQ